MAKSHAWAARAGALALLAVVVVWAGSATAGTPTNVLFTGSAQAGAARWDGHRFAVPAGYQTTVTLKWRNSSANLQLLVSGPDGSVIRLRPGHRHPKLVRFVALKSGTYWAGVRSQTGYSTYELSASWTPNKAPPVSSLSTGTTLGSPVTVNPLAHASSPDGGQLALKWVGTPSDGVASKTDSGSVTYKPYSKFSGTDSFAFKICDRSVIYD